MDEVKSLPPAESSEREMRRLPFPFGRGAGISSSAALRWTGGVLFTFAFAAAGTAIAHLPGLARLGPMVIAILLAVAYRQIAGYPLALASGIQFSSRILLRLAVILYGFRVNMEMIFRQGWHMMAQDTVSVVLALVLTVLLAKWLRADFRLSFLLGVGTGICGAAAIAAVAPLVRAKDEEAAVGVGLVALVGTLFTIAYTFIRPLTPLTDFQFGMWAGTSLHEIAHVAAAAAPAGQQALAEAILAKLGRVALLVPVSLALLLWSVRLGKSGDRAAFTFPWFLLGFIGTSLLATYTPLPAPLLDTIAAAASWLLTAAMVGLGLNVSARNLFHRAAKPLVAMLLASTGLSIASYWFTVWFAVN